MIYRGLVKELAQRGHSVTFFERKTSAVCDLPPLPGGRLLLYDDLKTLKDCYTAKVQAADLVLVGSGTPEGTEIGRWVTKIARGVTAFYDMDTPITLAKLPRLDYLAADLIPRYQLYLSFTGGPLLTTLEHEYGAQAARPLYGAIDPSLYRPDPRPAEWELGYIGSYSYDRQFILDHLMLDAARYWPGGRFVVAGSQYPGAMRWPRNVQRVEHIPPAEHSDFYNTQRFTLNITRSEMIHAGYSPHIRLFEAAACGVPIITDHWHGLETFFKPGSEILIARNARDTLRYLREMSDSERIAIGQRARERVLSAHTTAQRVQELEQYVQQVEKGQVALAAGD
jgi:spore maturation protein CgeB